jgi:hypothetical protein
MSRCLQDEMLTWTTADIGFAHTRLPYLFYFQCYGCGPDVYIHDTPGQLPRTTRTDGQTDRVPEHGQPCIDGYAALMSSYASELYSNNMDIRRRGDAHRQ